MSNSVTYYNFLLFIQCYTDSVLPNTYLIFAGIPFHLLKISYKKRILTYEILKDHFLRLNLDIFRKF